MRPVTWIGLLCLVAAVFAWACQGATPGTIGICDRTPQVRNAILDQLADVEGCAEVTAMHLATVRELDLSDDWSDPRDPITTLREDDFDGLTSLLRMDLSRNRLIALPKHIFDPLTSLDSLNLSLNELTVLPEGIFDQLNSLEALYVAGNNLASLPDGIFDNLTLLVVLSLWGNDLTTLPKGAFDRLTLLEQLDLHLNDLESLPADIFDELHSLDELHLQGNPLHLEWDVFDGLPEQTSLRLDNRQLDSLGLTATPSP